ncbi:MAG: hypothetical protein GY926_01815 [bacterium]|nr:hypothetical protein [bacterium]
MPSRDLTLDQCCAQSRDLGIQLYYLGTDIHVQGAAEQQKVFYSGIAFGLGASALVGFVAEVAGTAAGFV